MKTFLAALLLVGIGLGIFFFFWPSPHYTAADILSDQTILLIQTPETRAARQKFASTALGRIWNEPEVRQFLQRPMESARSKIGEQKESVLLLQEMLKLFGLVEGESFLALTDISISPHLDFDFIAGFDASHHAANLKQEAERFASQYQVEFPSAELEDHREGSVKYHVLTEGRGVKLVYGRLGNLMLVSRSENAFKQAIACVHDKEAHPLGKSALYSAHLQHREGSDVLFFFNPAAALGKWQPFLQLQPALKSQGKWMPFQSIFGTSRFFDTNIEDQLWTTLDSEEAAQSDISDFKLCGCQSLKGVSSNALVYAAAAVNVPSWISRNYGELRKNRIGPWTKQLDALEQLLDARQIHLKQDLLEHLGPEVAMALEWGKETHFPQGQVFIECHEPKSVEAALHSFWSVLSGLAPGVLGEFQEIASSKGEPMLTLNGLFSGVRPTVAFHENWMIIGLDPTAVELAISIMQGDGPRLADSKTFQSVESRFGANHCQFVYCDEKRLFERTYDLLSGIAWLAGPLVPKLQDQVDLSRLPQTATISKYLGPAVSVTKVDGNGFHQSAYGPVNLTVMTGIEALAGAAAWQPAGQTAK